MTSAYLPSVVYEPPGKPSLFDCWESGADTTPAPPLAIRDPAYRSLVVRALQPYKARGARLVSVGAGNGFVEVELAAGGWSVLATDVAPCALKLCQAKGLATASYDLLGDAELGSFDVVYCDGVLGHLWQPGGGTQAAWRRLATLGRAGSLCLTSNDLCDEDAAQLDVNALPDAAFFRPPAGVFLADALATGLWAHETGLIYDYIRGTTPRQRELLLVRLLVDERVEAEDRP